VTELIIDPGLEGGGWKPGRKRPGFFLFLWVGLYENALGLTRG